MHPCTEKMRGSPTTVESERRILRLGRARRCLLLRNKERDQALKKAGSRHNALAKHELGKAVAASQEKPMQTILRRSFLPLLFMLLGGLICAVPAAPTEVLPALVPIGA